MNPGRAATDFLELFSSLHRTSLNSWEVSWEISFPFRACEQRVSRSSLAKTRVAPMALACASAALSLGRSARLRRNNDTTMSASHIKAWQHEQQIAYDEELRRQGKEPSPPTDPPDEDEQGSELDEQD